MSFILSKLRALPSVQVTLAVALLVLGFLIAAQIAAEGPRVRYSTEERSPLIETALGLQSQQEALQGGDPGAAPADRRRSRRRAPATRTIAAPPVRAARGGAPRRRADRRVRAGRGLPVRGRHRGGPASTALVTARDVRVLVQELWLAGAEGIAVNGERIVGIERRARHRRLDPRELGVPRAAVHGHRDRAAATCTSGCSPRRRSSQFVQGRIERSGIRLTVARAPTVDLPGVRRHGRRLRVSPTSAPVPSPASHRSSAASTGAGTRAGCRGRRSMRSARSGRAAG